AADAGPPAGLAEDPERHPPDLLGIVLHPAGTRVVLPELRVGASDDPSLTVEDENGRPGRPLIDRDDARHQRKTERRRRRPSSTSACRRSRTASRTRPTAAGSSAASRP